jgi:hypothetical protein
MDENQTSHASPVAGNLRVAGIRQSGSNHPVVRDRIPGFHEDSMKTAVSPGIALRHRLAPKTHQCP